jgi:hypothetical protein
MNSKEQNEHELNMKEVKHMPPTNERHCQRQFKNLTTANEHEFNTKSTHEHQAWQQRHCQCHFESSKKVQMNMSGTPSMATTSLPMSL